MTDGTILTDGLLLRRGVTFVVAAKTAGVIGVAEISRIGAPLHVEVRKHVALIEGQERHPCIGDVGNPFGGYGRVLLAVESAERRREKDCLRR